MNGYGWIPDLPDKRDHKYAVPIHRLIALPPKVDLRDKCPAVYNQYSLGSCTGNAIGFLHHFQQIVQVNKNVFQPSRLFIYYNERVIEGTVRYDVGAQIRDGMKTVAKQGVPSEGLWPYDIDKFMRKPPKKCYTAALKSQSISYSRISSVPPDPSSSDAASNNLNAMQACLADGHPFVFGFTVYESFESDEVKDTGIVPMPLSSESVLGGHAVAAVGYDVETQCFIVRNSWGEDWGMAGYFTMPFAYLKNSNLVDDIWTIRLVEAT